MTITVKPLISAKQAENATTTQYTAPTRAIIDKFTATNTSGAMATLSVNIVTSAGSAGDSNMIVKEKQLNAGETYTFPELVGQALAAGDFISTTASAASAITIRASGREIT